MYVELSGANESGKARLDNGVMLFENLKTMKEWIKSVFESWEFAQKWGGFWQGKEKPIFVNKFIKGE